MVELYPSLGDRIMTNEYDNRPIEVWCEELSRFHIQTNVSNILKKEDLTRRQKRKLPTVSNSNPPDSFSPWCGYTKRRPYLTMTSIRGLSIGAKHNGSNRYSP
jgi:hypothetical protein